LAQPAAGLRSEEPDASAVLRREARDAAEEPQQAEVAAQDAAEEPRLVAQDAVAARAEVLRLAVVPDAAVPLRVAPGALAARRPSVAVWACRRDRLHCPAPLPAARFGRAMTGRRTASP